MIDPLFLLCFGVLVLLREELGTWLLLRVYFPDLKWISIPNCSVSANPFASAHAIGIYRISKIRSVAGVTRSNIPAQGIFKFVA